LPDTIVVTVPCRLPAFVSAGEMNLASSTSKLFAVDVSAMPTEVDAPDWLGPIARMTALVVWSQNPVLPGTEGSSEVAFCR
jgi:hypothetical protein